MSNIINLIESNPEILSGKPVIKGTRISVAHILQCIASGMLVEDILRGYPHLTRKGVLAAISYAAKELQGEEVYPVMTVK
ncbi:MAG: DUF433 domain-containing protein [Elusimicrobia bacterium]|nr:DUF433 domain-containing protein [Elusimicrobiota bacterium]